MKGDDQWVIDQCLQDGIELPPHLANKPEIEPGLSMYWEAFSKLGSCRQIGMGIGPVPWTAIEAWADAHGYDDDHREDLHYHVEALDAVYMKHANKSS